MIYTFKHLSCILLIIVAILLLITILQNQYSVCDIMVFIGCLFLLSMINKSNNTVDRYQKLEISPYKLCRGGLYMNQGNSERAKFCQEYAKSAEGKEMLSKYSCPLGNSGMNKKEFQYSALSDSNYENATCKDTPEQVVQSNQYAYGTVSKIGLF